MPPTSPSAAPRREPPPSTSGPPGRPPLRPPSSRGAAEQPTAHAALIGVAAPALVISPEHGQLTGEGMDGFYSAGRRVVARCLLRFAGREPVPLQGRMVNAAEARFTAAARTGTDSGPDPEIIVERLRSAAGTERITVRNAGAQQVRVPVEIALGTDLAELGAVAAGLRATALPAAVHGAGLSWTAGSLRATVTTDPAPGTAWASAGLLHWEWELEPGAARTVRLTTALTGGPDRSRPETADGPHLAAGPAYGPKPRAERPPLPWGAPAAEGDDPRLAGLFRTSVDDLAGLLQRDAAHPCDLHLAAGAPWRCAFAPAESLRAARSLLPLGTRLAAGTMRTLARGQLTGPGPDAGRLPGPLRHNGPHTGPGCTGTEATLLFPAVLAEAWRWGLSDDETEQLLPTAERCLRWLLRAAENGGYVPDPAPDGPYRCETQAHAHRAALLGAGLLDELQGGGPAGELWDWAAAMRSRFRTEFWHGDRSGGRPAALRTRDGVTVPYLGAAAAELLDTGLTGGGRTAEGLLDGAQTDQLARLLGGPALDSGWGLRSLGAKEPRYNPFGHRGGAVHVQDTATAVAGLAAAGYEKEAGSLLCGVLEAAGTFGGRLPEMYAAEQRTEGSAPLPHPAACRPSAVAAAGAVRLLATLAGVHPDAPAGTVTLRPMATAPVGTVRVTGLSVAGAPFSVRVSRLGMALAEEAADGLQLLG